MTWRVAKSLETLRAQINAQYPNRDKSNDGTIGDASHASRDSDHNPWVMDGSTGVVTALDITHDPAHGVDAPTIAEALRLSRDPRIKYIISNKRIANHASISGQPAWAWRPYSGANDHTHHFHLSVVDDKSLYDNTAPFSAIDATVAATPGRMTGITATVFGGTYDPNTSAYDEHPIGNTELGVALPYHFPKPLPRVRVFANGKSVDCAVVDVGPWNSNDPYWQAGARPQAESGTDSNGRKTNHAGIDLTVAAAAAIGIPGKGTVDWEFILTTTQETPMATTTTTAAVPAAQIPTIQIPHIDFATIEKMIESVSFVLPIIATFVPQAKPLLALIPMLEQGLKAADDIQHTVASGGDIWSVIASHLHIIADQVKAAPAAMNAATPGAPTNGMPNS